MNMQIRKRQWKIRGSLLTLGLLLSGGLNAAGLLEVKQTVFGMDCAPCAHGVEKGLEGLKGVQDATVSLNEGFAAVTLKPSNQITLAQIQQLIRENGFTPKGATLRVSGNIARANGQLILRVNEAEHFALMAAPGAQPAWQELVTLPEGAPVELRGRVGEDGGTDLSVLAVEPTS